MKIETSNMSGYGWNAMTDNYEPGMPLGIGATEAEAVAEQAGKPREAYAKKIGDSDALRGISIRLFNLSESGELTMSSAREILAEELRPLLEKARASLIIENGTAEALDAELGRWEKRS